VRSSEPAIGRSKVTVIVAVGAASPVGVTRSTRNGGGANEDVSEPVRASASASGRMDGEVEGWWRPVPL
jgi:hypothetical protein